MARRTRKTLPELTLLQELRARPSSTAVAGILYPHLENWRTHPRMATAVLRQLAVQGRPQLAAEVLSAMESHGIETNIFHYSASLSACSDDWLLALCLAQRMERSSIQRDAVAVSSQMQACARARRWYLPVSLMLDLCSSASRLDTAIYNTCVASCQQENLWQSSWRLLRGIWESELKADVLAFNALSAAPWPSSVFMLRVASSLNLKPDVFCFNSAIGEASQTSWNNVLGMLDSMPVSELHPDIATYDASIGVCGGTHWEKASQLWSLLQVSCRPDTVALTAMLSTCAHATKWKEALNIQRTCQGAQQVDLISCNALVNVCAKGSTWHDALSVFRALPTLRILPDDATRSSLFTTLSEAGRWGLALSAFAELEHWLEQRSQGSQGRQHRQRSQEAKSADTRAVVCSALMSVLATAGRWQLAQLLLCIMKDLAVETQQECHNAAIDAYGRASQWQRALDAFVHRTMTTSDCIALNAAIGGQARGSQWCSAVFLLVTAPSWMMNWSPISFSSATYALARCLLWDRSLYILSLAKQAGLVPDSSAYNAATCSFEQGRWARTCSLLCTMGRLQVERDDVACSKLVSSGASKVQWALALGVMDEMSRNSQPCTGAVVNCVVRALSRAGRWTEALQEWASMPNVPAATLSNFSNFMLDSIILGYMTCGSVRLLPAMLNELCSTRLTQKVGRSHVLKVSRMGVSQAVHQM